MQEILGGLFENVLDDCGIVSPKLFTKKYVSATSYADWLQYKAGNVSCNQTSYAEE